MHADVESLLKQFELCEKVKAVNERPEIAVRLSRLCELVDQTDKAQNRAGDVTSFLGFIAIVLSMIVSFFLSLKTVFPYNVYTCALLIPCYVGIKLYCLPIKKRTEQELRQLMEDPLSKEAHELMKLLDENRYKRVLKVIHFL